MNKLLTNFNGGFPFVLDDVRFLQDAIWQGLEGLTKAFGNCRLVGAVVSDNGTSYDVTEGFIILNGEVLYVPADSVPAGADIEDYGFLVSETFDAAGDKVFQDASTQQTYQLRTAKLAFVAGNPNGLTGGAPLLKDLLKDHTLTTIQPQVDAIETQLNALETNYNNFKSQVEGAWTSFVPSTVQFTRSSSACKYKTIGKIGIISIFVVGTPLNANSFELAMPSALAWSMSSDMRVVGYSQTGPTLNFVALRTRNGSISVENMGAGWNTSANYTVSGQIIVELD